MKWAIKEAVGKKPLDSNVFVSSQVPSHQIETEVISPNIEDESEEELSLLPANRNKFGLEHKKDAVLERLNAQITANEEEEEEEEEEEDEEEREFGYSHKGWRVLREVPDIIDSNMETDIDLEYNRLKEQYHRTINHLLQTFKNCFMDPDDLFGDWEFEIYSINMEMETANNDIKKYITTHYPSYLHTRE